MCTQSMQYAIVTGSLRRMTLENSIDNTTKSAQKEEKLHVLLIGSNAIIIKLHNVDYIVSVFRRTNPRYSFKVSIL